VQHAIDRGRDFLFTTQKNGNWELVQAPEPDRPSKARGGQWGGLTAIATLSLLAAGVEPTDPHVKAGLEFLKKVDMKGDYALGLRAQVWGALPQEPWVRAAELADCQTLQKGLRVRAKNGDALYPYVYDAKPGTAGDRSVSQFDVLGMWAMAQAGIEVPTDYWRTIDAAWHKQQLPDGSWSYDAVPTTAWNVPTLSMTAAGLATLFITQEYTVGAAHCTGNVPDPVIDRGLKFMADNLLTDNRRPKFYTLFGVSRVGLASGYKYLGPTDWFQWGADRLVKQQRPDGSFGFVGANEVDLIPSDTAFALLFLSRGRAPVMLNKLEYDAAGTTPSWNQRPRDAANLSRWVGKQIESPLNWQVVSLRASAEDLHDAPILYMAGGKMPKLTDADAAKLRAYIDEGGLLLGHADCSSVEFANGFRALGERLFPGRHFRPLEATSPIFTNESFAAASWSPKVAVEALSNGDRELMVLLPAGDPARVWQTQSFQNVRRETSGQLMIDLFLYAVDKQGLRRRGETYLAARDPKAKPKAKGTIARIKYAGEWDPEPGGWARLANVMHNAGTAELTVEPVDPAAGGKVAGTLASLTVSSTGVTLPEATRAALRDYVHGGGTLLVDVAGGRSPGRAAAEAELARLFPDAPRALPVLPPDAPVYAAAGPAMVASTVDYRRFERPAGNLHVPQLRGFTVGDRVAVFYSPQDLSVGLVGMPIDGVAGYAPADATKVVADVIAYAAAHH
jgi:hypothetical protein